MANILPENPQWVSGIYQLDKTTPVLGGPGGPDNRAAQQLGDRTAYLKQMVDGMSSGETPFSDVAQAQQKIDAGVIPLNAKFSVRSADNRFWVDEYQNINGVATPTGRRLLSEKEVNRQMAELRKKIMLMPADLAEMDKIFQGGVRTPNGFFLPMMLKNGRLCFVDEIGKIHPAASDNDVYERPLMQFEDLVLPDGAVCHTIKVDRHKNIAAAWTRDGGYYVNTAKGLKRTGDEKLAAANIFYSTAAAMIAGVTSSRISVEPDDNICYIIVTWGQSLAEGWNTNNDVAVATDILYPEHCLMFKSNRGAGKENPNRDAVPNTELESLKETISGNWKETAASSIASHIVAEVEKHTGKRIRTLSYVAASGGKPYYQLTRGTPAWDALVQGLVDAKAACEARGWKPVVLALDVMAGESDTDNVSNMTVERYKRQLQQLDRQFNFEVARIFNQPDDAMIAVSQCAFTPGNDIWNQKVRQAQLDADGVGNIRLVGPVYPYPSGDKIHINSRGQNRRGQAVARAILWEKFATGWRTMRCVDHTWVSDTVFRLVFDAQNAIRFDTSNAVINTEGLGPGLGFVFDDYTSTPPAITKAEIIGNSVVQITLSAAPATKKNRVGYAIKRNDGNTTQDGPDIGARGALCCSTAHMSLYEGINHTDWCPAFIRSI